MDYRIRNKTEGSVGDELGSIMRGGSVVGNVEENGRKILGWAGAVQPRGRGKLNFAEKVEEAKDGVSVHNAQVPLPFVPFRGQFCSVYQYELAGHKPPRLSCSDAA